MEIKDTQRFVTVQGQHLIGPDGEPMLLKGMGLGNWLLPEGYMFGFRRANSPRLIHEVIAQLIGEAAAAEFWQTFRERYITAADIRYLKDAGLNHLRVPFNFRLFTTEGPDPELAGPGYALLDALVAWCRDAGLYIVLDMHGAPGGQTGDNIDDSWGYPFLFEDEESQTLTLRLWQELARRYADESIILGYDLLNEPIAPYFDTARLNAKLEPLYRRIVAAIREVDPNHIVFLGGAQWNTNFDVFGPPFDDKSAYTFHRYWEPVTPTLTRPYLEFSKRYNVPLYMGESGENTYAWIAEFRELLESHAIGWSFWTYKRVATDRCIASIPQPEGWDAIVEFAEHPRSTYQQIREQRIPIDAANATLNEFLALIAFDNCTLNEGYLEALGLKS